MMPLPLGLPRNRRFAALVLAAVVATPASLWAEEKEDRTLAGPTTAASTQPSGKGFSSEKGGGRAGEVIQWLRATVESVGPTEEQKAQVHGLVESHRRTREKWRADHDAELKKIKDDLDKAAEAKDRDKVRAAREKAAALWSTSPKLGDLLASIRQTLTEDQRKKFDAAVQAKRDELAGEAAMFFEERPRPMRGPERGGPGGPPPRRPDSKSDGDASGKQLKI